MKKLTEMQKAEILQRKEAGMKPTAISREMRIPLSTVRNNYYPSLKAYMKAYSQRPEVKAYKKAYHQRPEVIEREKKRKYVIDVFTDFETGHTFDEIRKECGGRSKRIREDIDAYEGTCVITKTIENGIEVYRLNPDSPFHKVADGFFKKESEKLRRPPYSKF